MEKGTKNSIWHTFWADTRQRFSLGEGSAPQQEVVQGITEGIFFRGANMWILMFATLVASLGLNVNSTAVIIGAMLISPLMGPIMGFGLSLGINDFGLMNRSLRNFGFMVGTAITVATLFFLAVPVSGAQSELLARTQPTIFDVLIAFFGGAAGVVAFTRKDRTFTVISGVAIATALMPPLCTAGYGIATAQWQFFGGALYLFLINAIFIALSTYAIVRVLGYSRVAQVERRTELRVKRVMWTIIVVTVLPSVFIAFRLIDKSVYEANVARFVDSEFHFETTAVLERESTYAMRRGDGGRTVTLMLWGEPLPDETIENIRGKMSFYDLDGTALTINQAGSGGASRIDVTTLQQGYAQVLEEKNRRIAELERALAMSSHARDAAMGHTVEELRAIAPGVERVSLSRHPVWTAPGVAVDTVLVCILSPPAGVRIPAADLERLTRWLEARHRTQNVKIYVE
ncbi:MAG: DUF389 domain-containing protein [Alistipes sp.]|jgi:uncharacterized hydrophobic protein (TIGR00271 family)|nr:DUF389 domain-containing protein [Alistipes sp.]